MNRVLNIGVDTLTVEAGAIHIDLAKTLKAQNLQFYVNTEIGSLSSGSAACAGTKDASTPNEYGQVGSYVTGVKMVLPSDNKITIEFRRYNPGATGEPDRLAWGLRNHFWGSAGPKFGHDVEQHVTIPHVRYGSIDSFNALWRFQLENLVRGDYTIPSDQIIHYPAQSDDSRYTFCHRAEGVWRPVDSDEERPQRVRSGWAVAERLLPVAAKLSCMNRQCLVASGL